MNHAKTEFTLTDGVGRITMNSPENLNAIDVEMARELLERLAVCEQDARVKTVLVTGGQRAFSAGGDIGYLYRNIESGTRESGELVDLVGRLALTIKRMDKLVVTAVCGPAAGAGANLALSGDFCIAGDNAKFIQAFAGIALVPDTGGAYLLSRSIGAQRALELCVTGRPVQAEEALRLGLVYEVCPGDEVPARAMSLARALAEGPALAYAGIKRQVAAAAFRDYEWYLKQVEEPTMNACAETRDYREGVRAFMEKRPPRFIGG